MRKKVLVLGGYGTFGGRISAVLAADPGIECIVAGRSPERGRPFAERIGAGFLALDIANADALRTALDGVFVVVHACGPFQERGYEVAEACIRAGAHYVDMADSRSYVKGIVRLDDKARERGCLVVSGAGSVPAVSAALVDSLAEHFDTIDEIHTAIAPGNRNPRGLATVRAILSYTGRALEILEHGRWRIAYGWSEPQTVRFPAPVGRRRVYLCDVPDLDLFPKRYGAHSVSFRAGLELGLFNRGLALLGRLKRRGRIADLPRLAQRLIAASNWFRNRGGPEGGMRVLVRGTRNGQPLEHQLFLIARDGNGPAIPCSPAVALVKKWVAEGVSAAGAVPCVGLVTLDDIRAQLRGYDIVLVYV